MTCAMASVPSGVTWNGAANAEKSGANEKSVTGGVTPIGMPMIVAATMEISRAPFEIDGGEHHGHDDGDGGHNGRSGW